MINVLFVDDEVLAMEYLQNIIDWEGNGFHVVGHAKSAKSALAVFEKEKPQLVISDIKMAGMDGLELTAKLKERNRDVTVILLSAYCDFEYAKKGIGYGVFDYLLKHELNEETLKEKLGKVKVRLKEEEEKRRIYRKYFASQLIYNEGEASGDMAEGLGNRFFLMLVHKNDLFEEGAFREQGFCQEEAQELDVLLESAPEGFAYISDVNLSANNRIVLYRIENISSRYLVGSQIERMCRKTGTGISALEKGSFNIIFSGEITRKEISAVFRSMACIVRYAMFLRPGGVYDLNRLHVSQEEERIPWNTPEQELRTLISEGGEIRDYTEYLFELVRHPVYNLRAAKELIYMLENLVRELETTEGLPKTEEKYGVFKLEEICSYYTEKMEYISREIVKKNERQYSSLVREILRYIRRNYRKELSLEDLGEEFKMNGVYLGQIFKKETGQTFLKYLTNLRVEEAKRLLDKGEWSISQVAEKVGYRTSQYFSQIFLKTTGMKPQEYRKWRDQQKKEEN